VRSWLVIPVMGALTGAGAAGLGTELHVAACAALAGAALAATIRTLAGTSPASLCGAVLAPLLALALLADHGALDVRACLASAAAGWTIAELARTTSHPLVAMLPAAIGAVLSPALVPLVPLAGVRLVTAPWQRPGWVVVMPALGVVACTIATLAGIADDGALAMLAAHWFAAPRDPVPVSTLAARAGDALGPLVAVAALAGAVVAARVRLAELALAAWIAGALLVDLRAGAIGPTTLAAAALCTAVAVGRFAASIKLASGQALAGAVASALLLVPPVWATIEHGPADRVRVADASR
jgi:hypothetical protein